MKPLRNAISYVIYNKDKRFLSVKRPEDDNDLPDVWGLPAGSVKNDETFEHVVLRSGRDKLGVELKIIRFINEGEIERKDYDLHMKLYEAKIVTDEPKVPQQAEGTQYQDWKWAKTEELRKLCKKALCVADCTYQPWEVVKFIFPGEFSLCRFYQIQNQKKL